MCVCSYGGIVTEGQRPNSGSGVYVETEDQLTDEILRLLILRQGYRTGRIEGKDHVRVIAVAH